MVIVCLGFVDGHIPFMVERIDIASLRCRIPVLPHGDGATTEPLTARTARCAHRTTLIVGQAPTCRHHIEAVASLTRGQVMLDRLPESLLCPEPSDD